MFVLVHLHVRLCNLNHWLWGQMTYLPRRWGDREPRKLQNQSNSSTCEFGSESNLDCFVCFVAALSSIIPAVFQNYHYIASCAASKCRYMPCPCNLLIDQHRPHPAEHSPPKYGMSGSKTKAGERMWRTGCRPLFHASKWLPSIFSSLTADKAKSGQGTGLAWAGRVVCFCVPGRASLLGGDGRDFKCSNMFLFNSFFLGKTFADGVQLNCSTA